MDALLLIKIIKMMLENIINSQNPVFWIDFFNRKLDRIFVQEFFDLPPELQLIVRIFFFELLVQSEFGNVAMIVLREKFVKMSEAARLDFLKQQTHYLASLVDLTYDSSFRLDGYNTPPCIDCQSSDDIFQICQTSMDNYRISVKQTTGVEITGVEYLNRLRFLVDANFWVMRYFQFEQHVEIVFNSDSTDNPKKLRLMYSPFNPSNFKPERIGKVLNPEPGCKNRISIPSKCRTLTLVQKYKKSLRRFKFYLNFLQRNPEFRNLPVQKIHEELDEISEIKKNPLSKRKIVLRVIDTVIPKPLVLDMINFNTLIHFLLSCLDFTTPYVKFSPEQALQEAQTDMTNISSSLRLAIISVLSMTFDRYSRCKIAEDVLTNHVIPIIKKDCQLSPCVMSRTKVHYECENCFECFGCININTVSKYGDNFKIVPNGFRKILLLTCFGEYNSFFAFVMFLCQINKKFCRKTNAPKEFQELHKFLEVVFGLHSHYLPDFAVLLKTYNVVYDRQCVFSMTNTIYDLFSRFDIEINQCDRIEDQIIVLNSNAAERKNQSCERRANVRAGKETDEDATGLPWNHSQVLHLKTGGE